MHTLPEDRRYLIPFRSVLLPQIFTDVLVIGAGVAGLRAALAASEYADVIVACKGDLSGSNTWMAQGGIAAVLDRNGADQGQSLETTDAEHDSWTAHITDTLNAGAGLCDESMVRRVVEAAPARIAELLKWGMRFDTKAGPTTPTADLALGREGGHTFARILHAHGDATGRELMRTLHQRVGDQDRVRLFDQCFVLDLLTVDAPPSHGGKDAAAPAGRCVGAITHHPKYGLQVIWAGATILASGGCGQVYRESTNPPEATGDGLAMAYRAGARLADMAFVQFHPTTLYIAGAARSLISEAVRGEGAVLIDRNHHRFMPEYDSQADLAPRDIVSRAILAQMAKTHFSHVYLDCRPIGRDRFAQRFPGIYSVLQKFGMDPGQTPIPVHPSAHYMVGGVHTDEQGRTGVDGLYACGEAASTGLNGANRLASNSLLEGLVLGQITGSVCREAMENKTANGEPQGRPVKIVSDIRPSDRSELDLADVRSSLRSVMWRHVGIEREGDRLAEVMEMFEFWSRYTLDKIFDERAGWEVQNMLLVGALITRSAQWRCESRGTHYRNDHPYPAEDFRCHDLWQRSHKDPAVQPVRTVESPVVT